jgi:hypothetical protein
MVEGVLDNGQFLRPDYGQMGIHTWPEILAAEGYYTAAIGKMHFYPWDLRLGFQYRVIAEDKRWIHIRMDSIPLPELGICSCPDRDCIIGMMQGGWMVYDGEWRLSKPSSKRTPTARSPSTRIRTTRDR